MIYIRTDANHEIATGHVMRCLTIAEELKWENRDVCFVVSDEASLPLIRQRAYPALVMQDDWKSPDIDREFFELCKRAGKQDILLVDSYYITNEYLKRMKSIFKIVVFDDLFSEKKDADILINYNAFYRQFDYAERYRDSNCKLLLGEKYVPLREQFRETEKQERVRDCAGMEVLLMCGGGDRYNMILGVLQDLYQHEESTFSRCNWNVVIGSYYPSKDELTAFADMHENISVMENISNMAEVMSRNDLCVTAASTVLYECCAMLVPTIFFVVADDQIYDAECFSKDQMMLYCGNFATKKEESLIQFEKQFPLTILNQVRRQDMKEKMRRFSDADGAKRIVEAILDRE